MRPARRLRGLQVHVAWRKSTQSADCWVPVSCRRTIEASLRHWRTMQRMAYKGTYVFPSRTSGSIHAVPHHRNRIGRMSFIKTLRSQLVDLGIVSRQDAAKVKGHSLRVAGSNNCRRQGIPEDVHRIIGGWGTLACSASYMAMTNAEQFRVTEQLALQSRVTAFTPAQARAAVQGKLPFL